MKIALVGYGKMGHIIEEQAKKRGHEIVATIDINNYDDIKGEAFKSADASGVGCGQHTQLLRGRSASGERHDRLDQGDGQGEGGDEES